MPGINEVWSLVSGTRSNPPHRPEYGAEHGQDGYYADLNGARQGHRAPYSAGEGSSEAAEYYYEDQYAKQQYQYDQYAESSAGYDGQAPYEQQGAAPGYEQQAHDDVQSRTYQQQPHEGARGRHGGSPAYEGSYEGGAGYEGSYEGHDAEYRQDGGYPQTEYRQAEYQQPQHGRQAQQTEYQEYGDYGRTEYPSGYAAESEYSGAAGPSGGSLFGATASFAMVGTATATATELLDADMEVPESPQGLSGITTLPERATTAPEASQAPGTAGSRRGGKPTLRTRPRTGPLGRVVQGVVLASLVAGATAYVAYDKTITLSIDGQSQTVHTFAGTVGAVLSADDVSTGSKDIVSPAPNSSADSGQTITVHYGRPLDLTVNGVAEKTWVHYGTVSAALAELGVRTAGAKSSDPMSADVPRSGMSGLVVYTMRHVTFLVDGKTVPVDTTAATVTAAMAQAGVVLHNQDAPSVAADSMPADGETISINRIFGSTETRQVSIPYKTTQVSDPNTYTGTSTVTTQGVDGVETVTYAVLNVNGRLQAPKQISAKVTRQPVDEVVSVGTKALPSSASSLNWTALATCESGDNPSENTGNGFYGMYQFTISTWDSLGGSGLPSNASAGTQTALAEKLYSEAGSGQWPVCGHYLFT
ncbi:MAG TPA: ubiquitin-like domain-containing protein [Actinospica sp.]|nr:ubiquitin-like domain-containing protein [Actinospica sp.]